MGSVGFSGNSDSNHMKHTSIEGKETTMKAKCRNRKRKSALLSSSLVFGHPVVADSLQLQGLQHTRPFCPSPSPGVCPSSCPLHRWCHPAISSSDALFSFCPQYFPASGTFPMSQLLASSDQNTGASTSASVLPMSIQDWFPLRLIGLISLLSKGLSGVFSSTTVGRHQFFWHSAFFTVQLSQPLCDHWEDQSLDYTDLCRYWCLCFSTHCLGLSKLSCQEATAFWLITSRSDFRAQEEEIHLFCFYLA